MNKTTTTQDDARKPVRLTKSAIDAAAHTSKPYILWDDKLAGFGVAIAAAPSTTRTFIVRYRVGGGRAGTRRQFVVGRYGALTPDKAREKAQQVLGAVQLGEDPQAARAEDRKVMTVADLLDVYLAEGCATKAASTVALDTIRIAVIKRLIGRRKATQLTGGDVQAMFNAIAAGHLKKPVVEDDDTAEDATADPKRVKQPGERARGGKVAATKAVKLLRVAYKWAITSKRVPLAENPTAGVKVFADVEKDRFLGPAELVTLGDVMTAAEAEPDPKARRAAHVRIIRLLLLTGCRKNEIARLRWSEVQDGYLQLEKSKTGRKAVHLSAAAQELLARVKQTGSPWVFPDPEHRDEPIRNLDFFWVGLRKRAGLDDVRIHDLRHSFASIGLAGGMTLPLIGKLLGHKRIATTQRYAHLSASAEKAGADKIAETITAALGGKSAEVKGLKEGAR
jgi:integrase